MWRLEEEKGHVSLWGKKRSFAALERRIRLLCPPFACREIQSKCMQAELQYHGRLLIPDLCKEPGSDVVIKMKHPDTCCISNTHPSHFNTRGKWGVCLTYIWYYITHFIYQYVIAGCDCALQHTFFFLSLQAFPEWCYLFLIDYQTKTHFFFKSAARLLSISMWCKSFEGSQLKEQKRITGVSVALLKWINYSNFGNRCHTWKS